MPMITSLANMTQIQGDVKNTEAEIYTESSRGSIRNGSFFDELIKVLWLLKKQLILLEKELRESCFRAL